MIKIIRQVSRSLFLSGLFPGKLQSEKHHEQILKLDELIAKNLRQPTKQTIPTLNITTCDINDAMGVQHGKTTMPKFDAKKRVS